MVFPEHIKQLSAYSPPIEERGSNEYLRLDFNERQGLLPAPVLQALTNIDWQQSKIYPSYQNLATKIANYANVKTDKVMLCNGSDQAIEVLFRTLVQATDTVILPSPSFKMFSQQAQVCNAKIQTIQYTADGSFDINKILELLTQTATKMLVLCNPNSPTGNLIAKAEIVKILDTAKANNTWVYIDEAYYEFSNQSAVEFLDDYENLAISRTFSKAFGLANHRIGYLLSKPQNLEQFLKVRGPYDISQVAAVAADAALGCIDDMRNYCDIINTLSKPMLVDFFQKNNIEFSPSAGNFIYFKLPIANLVAKLKQRNILIRPQVDGYARVSLGLPQQMQIFIDEFNQILKSSD